MNLKEIKELTRKDDDKSTFFKEISRLIEIGHQRLFVTPEDIRKFFPTAENNLEMLENVFEALQRADIPYIEKEGQAAEPMEDEEKDYLSKISSDDSIGLYFKEISRTSLLSAEEEIALA